MQEVNMPAEAIDHLEQSLTLARAQDDRNLEATCLSHLGRVSLQMEDCDSAMSQAETALTMRQERGLHVLATVDLVTLAGAYQTRGHILHALGYARMALGILDNCKGVGPEHPHHDYLRCYHVLSAAGFESEAGAALQSAYDLLVAQAGKIEDPVMKNSFLEQVRLNREIVAESSV
jgi:tetratricopeptide (TPR) repeat protein